MSVFRPTRVQIITAFFPLPLVVILFLFMLIDLSTLSTEQRVQLFLIFFPMSVSSWYLNIVVNNSITRKYPHYAQTVKRGLILLCVQISIHFFWVITLALAVLKGTINFSFLNVTFIYGNFSAALILGSVFNIIFTIIWQVEYIFKSWKLALEEKEAVERELFQLEFDRLKQQLNPHFLFNNLNILSSLIVEDKIKALFYLDEFSKVYRYLLRRETKDFAMLSEELAFIHSYAELVKIRFDNTVKLIVKSNKSIPNRLLPFLSLQLLVENAIKHNKASKSHPLTIEIDVVDTSYVIVSNNLQRKQTSVASNNIGLSNIHSKYRMLNLDTLSVMKSNERFEVKLPLINT